MTRIVTYPAFSIAGDHAPREGKFVQLSWRGEAYLVFATRDRHAYHNQILAHLLDDLGVAHRWVGNHLGWDDRELQVLGGGRFRLDVAAGRLIVHDSSSVYGPFDSGLLAEQLAGAGPPWCDLAVTVL
jgi:hypothetical protein